jgi:hypothetical protein
MSLVLKYALRALILIVLGMIVVSALLALIGLFVGRVLLESPITYLVLWKWFYIGGLALGLLWEVATDALLIYSCSALANRWGVPYALVEALLIENELQGSAKEWAQWDQDSFLKWLERRQLRMGPQELLIASLRGRPDIRKILTDKDILSVIRDWKQPLDIYLALFELLRQRGIDSRLLLSLGFSTIHYRLQELKTDRKVEERPVKESKPVRMSDASRMEYRRVPIYVVAETPQSIKLEA